MSKFEISDHLELQIRREFSERLKNFMAQKKWINDAIGSIVEHDQNLYTFHVRVKEISSVLKKIQGKISNEKDRILTGDLSDRDAKWMNANSYADFERLIDDWVGCRIVAYLHDSIIPLHNEIMSHHRFDVHRVTIHDSAESPRFSDIKIRKNKDEIRKNHTGYVGIHYIIRPKTVDPCWNKEPMIFNKFELQIRTLLQEAWGQIQHAVIYKGRMPDYIKQERSDSFGGLAGFLTQCDVELARLTKDPSVRKLASSKRSPKSRQKHFRFSKTNPNARPSDD